MLDRGYGSQPWYRVSWHRNVLLGCGYYRMCELGHALALVDVHTLVEVFELRPIADVEDVSCVRCSAIGQNASGNRVRLKLNRHRDA